jgi:hypothetical protein
VVCEILNIGNFFCVGDNGSMWFWDWKSGHNFQQEQTIVQPGKIALQMHCLVTDITMLCSYEGYLITSAVSEMLVPLIVLA